jgi:hypothetical protein
MMRRILRVGVTGAFGSRLAALLATFANIELVLAARGSASQIKLRDNLVSQNPAAHVAVQQFDRSHPESVADTSPWLVIHAGLLFAYRGTLLVDQQRPAALHEL